MEGMERELMILVHYAEVVRGGAPNKLNWAMGFVSYPSCRLRTLVVRYHVEVA